MKIKIENILSENPFAKIAFSTNFGKSTAIWKGDIPVIGHEYDVEFEIDSTLTWDKEILKSNETYGIDTSQSQETIIIGELDSLDEDGYAVLKLGNTLIPFMTTGVSFEVGTKIKIVVNNLSLYPY